jgi:ornithine carbamoyltransferase
MREKAFAGYCIDEAMVAMAHPDCMVLHCLPAHRGEEITDGVIEGLHSAVWDEAENRLHVQKAIMATLMK